MDSLILILNFAFLLSILFWATTAYAQMWFARHLISLAKTLNNILHPDASLRTKMAPNYLIAQGTYKGRKVVCRINKLPGSNFLRYNLDLNAYIQPLTKPSRSSVNPWQPTENTRVERDFRIRYLTTSEKTTRSFFITERISEQEIRLIFQELTKAAEIAEMDFSKS